MVEDLDGIDERAQDLSQASWAKSLGNVLAGRGWRTEHQRQLAPETTGAGCCACTGEAEGGASWPDPEEVPDDPTFDDDAPGDVFVVGEDVL